MSNNKAREINSPIIKQLINETTAEELAKIDTEMTNNKQQTAVEWLNDELIKNHGIQANLYSEFEQAKEMEKEQHATTWDKSMDNLDARGGNIVRAWVDFDEYYNETYGGNNE
jgi:hypothetical protein